MLRINTGVIAALDRMVAQNIKNNQRMNDMIDGLPDKKYSPIKTLGHPAFLKSLDDLKALHIKKAADYGSDGDVLANCRVSEEIGIPAWQGVVIRMLDKVQRIKNCILNGSLANESLSDSFDDLAAYSLIAKVLYEESK